MSLTEIIKLFMVDNLLMPIAGQGMKSYEYDAEKYAPKLAEIIKDSGYLSPEQVEKLQDDNDYLRELLWATHPCDSKYGDDGELQCNRYVCSIDFKRDDPEEIDKKIIIHNKLGQAIKEETDEGGRFSGYLSPEQVRELKQEQLLKIEDAFIWGQVPHLDTSGHMKDFTMRCIADDDWQALKSGGQE
jgi:hypothetical protein